MTDRITICASCRAAGEAPRGAALAARLRIALEGRAEVGTADCLNVCKSPLAFSVRATGKAAYLFAGVDPGLQEAEIVAFAALYAAAPGGEITDARPCGRLRHCLIGRIPA